MLNKFKFFQVVMMLMVLVNIGTTAFAADPNPEQFGEEAGPVAPPTCN